MRLDASLGVAPCGPLSGLTRRRPPFAGLLLLAAALFDALGAGPFGTGNAAASPPALGAALSAPTLSLRHTQLLQQRLCWPLPPAVSQLPSCRAMRAPLRELTEQAAARAARPRSCAPSPPPAAACTCRCPSSAGCRHHDLPPPPAAAAAGPAALVRAR